MPSALNSGQVRVAGSGSVWKAPLGTTTPTDSATAWGVGWVNLGYQTNGFTLTQDLKKQGITAWQTIVEVRSITTTLARKFAFENLQTNKDTIALAWGGATITPGTASAYTLAVPDGSPADFMLGIDWFDGTLTQRIILSQATLSSLPTIKFTRDDAVRLAVEVQALVPADGSASVKVFGVDAAVGS